MKLPKPGYEVQFGLNRYKISKATYGTITYSNGASDSWEDLSKLIWEDRVAIFDGENQVNLKEVNR
jgi:hypothetical protein